MRSRNIKTGPGGFSKNNPVSISVNFHDLSLQTAEVLLSSGVPLWHHDSTDMRNKCCVYYLYSTGRGTELPSRALSSSTLEADVLADVMKAFNELSKANKPTTGRNGKPISMSVFDNKLFR